MSFSWITPVSMEATAIDAFSAAETALIAVDAATGIRVNTRRAWEEAEKQGLARVFVITRLDTDGAGFQERVEEIQEMFGNRCVPLIIPDNPGPSLSRVERTYPLSDAASDEAKAIYKQLI